MNIRTTSTLEEIKGKSREYMEKDEVTIDTKMGSFNIRQDSLGELVITKTYMQGKSENINIHPRSSNQITIS